ncbi:HAD family hydrolase [Atopobium fossor]|uniref:HAD family hydrolase n=1 Tax=Atopobium fossor TaxID=39487 RepID=UPI0004041C7D|nr:HAD family phosphatase [Atopobium fossor]
MIQAALFDQDGLLFDTEKLWQQAWKPALADFGLTQKEGLAQDCCGTAGEQSYTVIRRYYGNEVPAQQIRDRLSYHARILIWNNVSKKPGADELLEYLRQQGVLCAVATSSDRELTHHNLEATGLSRYFDAVITADQVTKAKPDPEIFLTAAAHVGAQPAQTLVLEDSFSGVRAGVAGGFITVMVPDLSEPTAEIAQLAYAVCPSLYAVKTKLVKGELG